MGEAILERLAEEGWEVVGWDVIADKMRETAEAEVRHEYIDQVPMKRPCQCRDVTNFAVFLASDDAGYMTGQAINVTGGQEDAIRDRCPSRLVTKFN